MNLKCLFSIMYEKKFSYFNGFYSDNGAICINFSTGYNGRGSSIDLTINGEICDLIYYKHGQKVNAQKLSENQLMMFFKNLD